MNGEIVFAIGVLIFMAGDLYWHWEMQKRIKKLEETTDKWF